MSHAPLSSPERPAGEPFNPYIIALAIIASVALLGGIITAGVATSTYAQQVKSSFSEPDAGLLGWVSFGGQVAALGVVMFIGLLFIGAGTWKPANDEKTPSHPVKGEEGVL